MKIAYSTPYADYDYINGYVYAYYDRKRDAYVLNERQVDRACRNLTIGGVLPTFHTDRPICVIDKHGNESIKYFAIR